VADTGISPPRGGLWAIDRACEGARFHSPTPLVLTEVALAPDGEGTTVKLCGLCADTLAVFQALLVAHQGIVHWQVRRDFGNVLRALAMTGWEDYCSRHPEMTNETDAALEANGV